MKIKFKFAPGQKVKDTISGIEGIISASVYLLEGYNQHQVQPQAKDGTMPDAWIIDDCQLLALPRDSDAPDFESLFKVDFKYIPGSKAKDTISGIEGIITKAVIHANGCIYYKIAPKAKKGDNIQPEGLLVNEKLTELILAIKEPKIEEKPRRGFHFKISNQTRI